MSRWIEWVERPDPDLDVFEPFSGRPIQRTYTLHRIELVLHRFVCCCGLVVIREAPVNVQGPPALCPACRDAWHGSRFSVEGRCVPLDVFWRNRGPAL